MSKNTTESASSAELDTYKGNPMIVLKSSPDTRWPFQFGIGKAKLILAHIEEIKAFVESDGAEI